MEQTIQAKEKVNGESESGCNCINGIGSTENDIPITTSLFSSGISVSLCGYFDVDGCNIPLSK